MIKYHSLCSFFLYLVHFIFIFILILIHPSVASKNNNNNVTQLVNDVCVKTSNYTFCVESLYSDPHTPESDQYGLAIVAFRLAYLNATSTKEYIAKLLKKKGNSSHYYMLLLQKCENDYRKAVSAIENAYNDLNSETFFELADLAGVASNGAEDCQEALKGTSHGFFSKLEFMNNALNGLCEICTVISKLFTG